MTIETFTYPTNAQIRFDCMVAFLSVMCNMEMNICLGYPHVHFVIVFANLHFYLCADPAITQGIFPITAGQMSLIGYIVMRQPVIVCND